MNNRIENCGKCPNWEYFLTEDGLKKGRCTKYSIHEVPETKASCEDAYNKSAKELISEW